MKYINELINSIVKNILSGNLKEAKGLLVETTYEESQNEGIVYLDALVRVFEENWSDMSVHALHKYFKGEFVGFMRARGDEDDRNNLVKVIDETLSENVLDHIQDVQYWYENSISLQQKVSVKDEFCAHILRLIETLLDCAKISLANVSDEDALKNGLNMLENCLACVEEVGDYLDKWVISQTPYTQTKIGEIKALSSSQNLQEIIAENADEYMYLSDL